MTKREINRFERLKKARKFMEDQRDVWESEPAVEACLSKIDIEIEGLSETLRAQINGTKSITQAKRAGKLKLRNISLLVGGILSTYADDVGDEDLKSFSTLTPSKIIRMRDVRLIALSQGLIVRAERVGTPVLAEYGLDSDRLDSLKAELESLSNLIVKPRQSQSQLATMQKMVSKRLARVRYLLTKQLRNLLAPFMQSNLEFWEGYKSSLMIFDVRSKAVKNANESDGIVSDTQ